MRLFVAVLLEDALRDALAGVQARLRATGADVRWVEPANFHLTVKFLGEQPEARRPEIEAVCAEVAAATPCFAIALRGAGAFPKRGPLKTIWVGLSEGGDAWRALAKRAETPLSSFGVAREGGLVPHITLGRVLRRASATAGPEGMEALRAALTAEAAADCGGQQVDRITLVQSTLDPRGAVYTPLRDWPLEKN